MGKKGFIKIRLPAYWVGFPFEVAPSMNQECGN